MIDQKHPEGVRMNNNVSGIRRSSQNRLNAIIGHKMENGAVIDETVLTLLAELTRIENREVLIVVSDNGIIENAFVGDVGTVAFDITDRRSTLSRKIVIHTHPGGSPFLSDEDLSAAKDKRLSAMIAIAVPDSDDLPKLFGIALPKIVNDRLTYTPEVVSGLAGLNTVDIKANMQDADKAYRKANALYEEPDCHRERAILVGVDTNWSHGLDIDKSMAELKSLTEAADGQVVAVFTQSRPKIDSAYYVGKGKLAEISRTAQNKDAALLVANDELTASQIANIEGLTGLKVIDRTTVILDIFARHAASRIGKLQVELAQQHYRLSRLKGLGQVLSRTGGGIGTRGPGEKKLETDRRHIRKQIDELNKQLAQAEKTHAEGAKRRKKSQIPRVSLIGYTNAGKSTLFNVLTAADAVIADDLFVTLDTTTRQVKTDSNGFVLSDTVGFIEKLPHDLVAAFKTTLSEALDADLLLHVIDASQPESGKYIAITEQVLSEIGAIHIPRILVLNKTDLLGPEEIKRLEQKAGHQDIPTVLIAASTGYGIDSLLSRIDEILHENGEIISLLMPYSESKRLAELKDQTMIIDETYEDSGVRLTVRINKNFPKYRFVDWLV